MRIDDFCKERLSANRQLKCSAQRDRMSFLSVRSVEPSDERIGALLGGRVRTPLLEHHRILWSFACQHEAVLCHAAFSGECCMPVYMLTWLTDCLDWIEAFDKRSAYYLIPFGSHRHFRQTSLLSG